MICSNIVNEKMRVTIGNHLDAGAGAVDCMQKLCSVDYIYIYKNNIQSMNYLNNYTFDN